MSKQIYVYPNGTKVKIEWEGTKVGKGTIIDNTIEKDDNSDKKFVYYKVKIKDKGLFQMLGLSDEHWVNSFEVKPIQKGQ